MGAISSSSVNSVAASGNLVITAPASIVAGNLLVMICYNAGGGATVTPDTDWFLQIDSGVSNSSQAWVYTKTATISEPSTYTFNFDNSYNAMVCLQYPPLFIDSYIVNLDITDTLLTSAFSAYYSADQIVVGAGCGGGFTLATPTGLTFQDSTASYSNESLYAFDATALSTSIPSYSGLWSGTSAWTSIVFALSVTPPPSGASLTSDFSASGDATAYEPGTAQLTADFSATGDGVSYEPASASLSADFESNADGTAYEPATGSLTADFSANGDGTAYEPATGSLTADFEANGDGSAALYGEASLTGDVELNGDATTFIPATASLTWTKNLESVAEKGKL